MARSLRPTSSNGVSLASWTWDFGGPTLTAIVAYRDFRGSDIQDDFQASQVYSLAGITEDNLPPTYDDMTTFTAEAHAGRKLPAARIRPHLRG